MKNMKINILALALAGFFSAQAQATFTITSNLSKIEVTGSVNDYSNDTNNGYQDGVVYSSTTLPLHITQDDLMEGETNFTTASALSNAELDLNITQTANTYNIWGSASSHADTDIDSLNDNDAIAMGSAAVNLAFTLSIDHHYSLNSDLFDSIGDDVSSAELVLRDGADNSVISHLVQDDTGGFNYAGLLTAGDYTLYIGAVSEALDGGFASSNLEYNFQLTAVPLPAGLPLLLSGLAALGFKRRMDLKA